MKSGKEKGKTEAGEPAMLRSADSSLRINTVFSDDILSGGKIQTGEINKRNARFVWRLQLHRKPFGLAEGDSS